MRKPRLMTPGPAPVPEDVLLELARPVIHHRSAEAKQVITEVAAGLKEVCQTAHDVLILTASGTGAMEAALVNTVPRGGKALVLNAGHFAQRWAPSPRRSGSTPSRWRPRGAARSTRMGSPRPCGSTPTPSPCWGP
jgi:aspartate aminotransferase-like enzyme